MYRYTRITTPGCDLCGGDEIRMPHARVRGRGEVSCARIYMCVCALHVSEETRERARVSKRRSVRMCVRVRVRVRACACVARRDTVCTGTSTARTAQQAQSCPSRARPSTGRAQNERMLIRAERRARPSRPSRDDPAHPSASRAANNKGRRGRTHLSHSLRAVVRSATISHSSPPARAPCPRSARSSPSRPSRVPSASSTHSPCQPGPRPSRAAGAHVASHT
jgi:hypothetical protein